MVIDAPWNNTGCKLPYNTLDDHEWMSILNFDDLMDDGLVFMWVTNAKFEDAVDFMKSKGWYRIETIRWNKVTRDEKPARRGGRYFWHVGEDVLVFKRKIAINIGDKFMIEKAIENSIVSAVSAASMKPF
jgi:N6-adenosine-specific RNA methylase IME4